MDLAKVRTILDYPLPTQHVLFVPSSTLWDTTLNFMWDYSTITVTFASLLRKDRFLWSEDATTNNILGIEDDTHHDTGAGAARLHVTVSHR